MSSNIVLSKCLQTLSFLELSAIVSCEFGDVVIEVTQDGDFIVNDKRFKNIDQIIGFLGVITRIMTLNHETDEETILF